MSLQESSEEILNQLTQLLDIMEDGQYCSPVSALSESSIGSHVRHIIEFYQCMIKGNKNGMVNYDKRERNPDIESNRYYALHELIHIIHEINHITCDKDLKISMDFSGHDNNLTIDTTFYRELAYNIEHAIHHMAIIRIGIQTAFPGLSVGKNFGFAYSTIKHKALECAQ